MLNKEITNAVDSYLASTGNDAYFTAHVSNPNAFILDGTFTLQELKRIVEMCEAAGCN